MGKAQQGPGWAFRDECQALHTGGSDRRLVAEPPETSPVPSTASGLRSPGPRAQWPQLASRARDGVPDSGKFWCRMLAPPPALAGVREQSGPVRPSWEGLGSRGLEGRQGGVH